MDYAARPLRAGGAGGGLNTGCCYRPRIPLFPGPAFAFIHSGAINVGNVLLSRPWHGGFE